MSNPPSLPSLHLSRCDLCRTYAPTLRVSLHRHIGALILRYHNSLKGSLCKKCISQKFWEWTLVTLFFGWWGLISLFITPYVLVSNVVMYVRSRSLPKSDDDKPLKEARSQLLEAGTKLPGRPEEEGSRLPVRKWSVESDIIPG